MNIWTFCFSSKNVQLLCSRDANQKYYKIFYWFPVHLFYIGHGNNKFSYIYTIEIRKCLLWKTSRWNARRYLLLIKITKTIIKTRIGKPKLLENFPFKCNNFIYYITKIFTLYTTNYIFSFKIFLIRTIHQYYEVESLFFQRLLLLISTTSKFVKKNKKKCMAV